jgi:hypothetical protein
VTSLREFCCSCRQSFDDADADSAVTFQDSDLSAIESLHNINDLDTDVNFI